MHAMILRVLTATGKNGIKSCPAVDTGFKRVRIIFHIVDTNRF